MYELAKSHLENTGRVRLITNNRLSVLLERGVLIIVKLSWSVSLARVLPLELLATFRLGYEDD